MLLYALVDIKVLKPLWVQQWRRTTFLVVVIVLGWEVLGVLMLMRFKENFVTDTSLDLLFGILGSIIGWWIGKQLKKLEL
jgi:membrane protein YqaA with SNARE-associated domain